MAEIFIEERLGETRAAMLEKGRLVEMHIARDGDGLQAGAITTARLSKKLGLRGIATAQGEELLVQPWPAGLSEGAECAVEITRAAWREPMRERLAKARPSRLPAAPAPNLEQSLRPRGKLTKGPWAPEIREQWDDSFEAALLGRLSFEGGSLSLEPTAAMLAVDVDGAGPALARPALLALARAVRLYGLGGNIVADLPTEGAKADRTAAAEAFDAAMQGLIFERTAINGFGLLQVVCPRPGPSILERARFDSAGTEAILLLRAAESAAGTGPLRITARPQVIRWLQSRPHLIGILQDRTHRPIDLHPDPVAGSGHVAAPHS